MYSGSLRSDISNCMFASLLKFRQLISSLTFSRKTDRKFRAISTCITTVRLYKDSTKVSAGTEKPCILCMFKPDLLFKGVQQERTKEPCKSLSHGPRRNKTCLWGFANNKGADQPALPRRLINAFAVRLLESILSKLVSSELLIF